MSLRSLMCVMFALCLLTAPGLSVAQEGKKDKPAEEKKDKPGEGKKDKPAGDKPADPHGGMSEADMMAMMALCIATEVAVERAILDAVMSR